MYYDRRDLIFLTERILPMEQTNTLSASRLALTYAGSILGAGYLSGQELWQFFGEFGLWGLAGLAITLVVMSSLVILVMRLARATSIIEMDRLIIPWEIPFLRRCAAIVEIFFLLDIVIIMYAGGGALLEQLLGLPLWTGSLMMCILVSAVALHGLQGTVRFFSLLVPPTVVITILFGVLALMHFGLPAIPAARAAGSSNPLLGNWLFSALTYVSYNFFSIIGLMAAAGVKAASHRAVPRGAFLGSAFLVSIAVSILLALFADPAACSESLPMLAVAQTISPLLCYPYGLILFCGMFGAALFSIVTIVTYFEAKYPAFPRHKGKALAVISLVCFPASLAGFGNLIAVLYPICGYCGIFFILCLILHYVQVRKKEKAGPV